MARILVTGGAGYVGSHCSKELAAAGHDVVVFDSLFSGHREFVRWGELIEGDIRDRARLDQALSSRRFDAVIHFAARAYVGESVTAPGVYYDVNVNGTRVLLDAMVRTRIGLLVFSSSCAVYGEPAQMPITETSPAKPINPYGFTKFACERMMDDFGVAHGLKSVRLRYFNAAGADPAGEVGEDHDPETHLVPLILDVALGRRPEIKVFGSDYRTQDGTAVRDYIHVCDLASAHVLALKHLLSGGETMSLNLGTGAGASVLDVVQAVRDVTNRDVAVREAPRRPGDPAVLVADAARAREVLGWRVQRDLKTIVADAWQWHRARFGSGR